MEFYSHSESQSPANILFNGYFKPSAADLLENINMFITEKHLSNFVSGSRVNLLPPIIRIVYTITTILKWSINAEIKRW